MLSFRPCQPDYMGSHHPRPPISMDDASSSNRTSPPLDLMFLCNITTRFDDLWPVLGNVNREFRGWARNLWAVEAFRCAIRLRLRMRRCSEELGHRMTYLDMSKDDIQEAIYGMVTLQGTAAFVHHCILTRPTAPWCHEQLLLDPGVEISCMTDFPVTGRFRFDHIVEYLTRVGELRVFIADSDMDWAQSDQCVIEAARAYHRLLRTVWAWPRLGIAGWTN